MADDLTQRLMNTVAGANGELAAKDFQHTVTPVAPPNPLATPPPVLQDAGDNSGKNVHDELMRRAQARKELYDSMGESAQRGFANYTGSGIGSNGYRIAHQGDIMAAKQERAAVRQGRFKQKERGPSNSQRRQANANGAETVDKGSYGGHRSSGGDRQGFNSRVDRSGGQHAFSEPPTRNYNPYG